MSFRTGVFGLLLCLVVYLTATTAASAGTPSARSVPSELQSPSDRFSTESGTAAQMVDSALGAYRDTNAEPILVKVRVNSDSAWRVLRSLGAKLYHRSDGCAVVRMDPVDLTSLESAGIAWNPLFASRPEALYYMVPGRRTPRLPLLSGLQIVDEDEAGAIVSADPEAVLAVRELGYMTIPLDREWPVWPAGFLGVEFVHDAVVRDQSIRNLTRLVSEDTLRSYVRHLQDYGTRHTESIEVTRAGRWLVNTLGRFGYPDTLFEAITGPRGEVLGRAGNVEGSKPGATRPQFRVLVGGHYDSTTNGESVPPWKEAPGADDNATGIAAGLEIARLLASLDLDATVGCVFFSEEEQGLAGSRRYATQLVLDEVPTNELFFINMDMIGNADTLPWRVGLYTDGPSRPLAVLTGRVAEAYTEVIPVMMGNSGRSDHASLQQVGYPSIMLHEYDFSRVYHSRQDLLSYLEMDYMAEVVRIVIATVLHLATIADPPSNLVASATGDGEILTEWTHSPDADVIGYHVEVLDSDGEVLSKTFTSDNYLTLPSDVLNSGTRVRVRSEDVLGEGEASDEVFIGTGRSLASVVFPNPTSEGAAFHIFIPGSGPAVRGKLSVLDAAGRLVHSSSYNDLDRGTQILEWNGISLDGEALPSGVYFYIFEVAGVGGHGGKLLVVR